MSDTSSEDRGAEVLSALWIMAGVSGSILGLRLYCKLKKHRGLWWDDHMLVFSWLCLLVSAGLAVGQVQLGFGKHIEDIDVANLSPIGLITQLSAFFSVLGNLSSKISFAITMLRITNGGWLRATIWGIIVTMSIFMLLSDLIIFIQCTPVQKAWTPFLPGTCWDTDKVRIYSTFAGAYSGIMDIALALLPWTIIPKLQMNTRDKFGTAIAMSMGVFAGAITFVKCYALGALDSGDFTFDGVFLAIWGSCETAVTIIATSIPILRVLFTQIRSSARSRSTTKGGAKTWTQTTKNTTTIVTRARNSPDEDLGDDSSSAKAVLAGDGANQILRTDEFTTSYDTRNSDEELGYELNTFVSARI